MAVPYNDENQLISVVVTNNSGTSTRSDFVYDGKMRRRLRFESAWSATTWVTNTTVRYVYDGNLVMQERDANNLPMVSYTRGRDLSGTLQRAGGIGGLLARTDHSLLTINSSLSTSYYHADANGNITCLVSSNQTIVAKYLYDPFGNIISKIGQLADANLYRFSSKEFHSPSGTVYYTYRYYDPNLQRWLNRDPIEEAGGINLFAFLENNPPCWIDLFGLAPGDKYPSLNAAAIAVAADIFPITDQNKFEYFSWLYQYPDKTFSYTPPVTSHQRHTVQPDEKPFQNICGSIHSHASYGLLTFANRYFSWNDKTFTDNLGAPGFLVTPEGGVKEYLPDPTMNRNGAVLTIMAPPLPGPPNPSLIFRLYGLLGALPHY